MIPVPTAANANGRSRVLVVEDDSGLTRLMQRVLARRGFRVEAVAEAGGALEAVSNLSFDLMILDYQLPDMTGGQLIGLLREVGCRTPFVVVTGHGDEALAVEIMKLGARDYLVKDHSLLERLPNVLEQIARQVETEQRLAAAERGLERSRRNAQALLDASAEAAMLVDRQGTIVAANAILARQLERGISEVVGGDANSLLAGSPLDVVRQHIARATADRRAIRFELRERGRSLDTSVHPVLDAAGEIVDVAVYSRDVTEQVELAERLRQAQKMEAIGQLAGGVAHDFNNVLQIILGHVCFLEDHCASVPVQLEEVRSIQAAVDRATGLTRQLLAFSRRQVLRSRRLDLTSIVASTLEMLRRLIGEGIELDIRGTRGLPAIRGDRSQIEQILLNLCINARDAMPEGGRLTLTTSEESVAVADGPPERRVVLTVEDTGTGMDEEVLAQIFEPFYTTKEVGRGTGLGLATVYGIVEQHEGQIVVESEPGAGTRFEVRFPVYVGDSDENPVVERRPRRQRGHETVLVAEDDDDVRAIACQALGSAGYSVLSARDGDEAVAVLRSATDRVAIAVLDVVMPGLSGVNLGDALLAVQPSLPLLFATGYSRDVDRVKSIDDRGWTILDKPYTPRQLLQAVRDRIDEVRDTAEGHGPG